MSTLDLLNSIGPRPGVQLVVDPPIDEDADVPSLRTLGTGPNQAVAGNDPRLGAGVGGGSFANYAAIRAAEGTAGQNAIVNGRNTSFDGGEGVFCWTPDTVATDNGGTVLVPSASPRTGCWKRLEPEATRPTWFGAVGDGVANDIAAIIAAATAAATRSNKTVIIDKVYNITTASQTIPGGITLDFKDGGRFIGAGLSTLTIAALIDAGPYQIFEGPLLGYTGRRSIQGQRNFALWFGADPTGVSDSAPGLNAANITAAGNYQGVTAPSYAQTTGFAVPEIFLPAGKYRLESSWVVYSYRTIRGEVGTTIYEANASQVLQHTFPLIRCSGVENKFIDLAFAGGRNHIRFLDDESLGNLLAGLIMTVDRCQFRGARSSALQMDWAAQITLHNRGVQSLSMHVNDSLFEGPRFYSGGIDWAAFTNCRIVYLPAGIDTAETPYNKLGCFTGAGNLQIRNCFMLGSAPGASEDAYYIHWGRGIVSLIDGSTGDINCRMFKFEQLDGSTTPADWDKDWYYEDGASTALPVRVSQQGGYHLYVNGTGLGNSPGRYWLECYEEFPARVVLKNCGNFAHADLRPVNLTWGIFVHEDAAMKNAAVCLDVDNHAQRICQIARGTNSSVLNPYVTHEYAQFFTLRYPEQSQQSALLPNLFPTESFDLLPYSGHIGLSLTAAETDTGFGIRGFTPTASKDNNMNMWIQSWVPPDSEPGVYCVSFLAKCSESAPVWWEVLEQGATEYPRAVKTAQILASNNWRRFWFEFFSDGVTPLRIAFQAGGLSVGEALYLGCWQINRGSTPSSYMPPNVDAPNKRIRVETFLTAAPSAGKWRLGDIAWNLSPAAGGKLGWVCTTAGDFSGVAPTFKPFGAIDP